MAGRAWKNTYRLSDTQLERLDRAEDRMEAMDHLIRSRTNPSSDVRRRSLCIPVLSNLGHLYGRHLSDFEKAGCYQMVLNIEPDNAWARDERRRYQRYLTYD